MGQFDTTMLAKWALTFHMGTAISKWAPCGLFQNRTKCKWAHPSRPMGTLAFQMGTPSLQMGTPSLQMGTAVFKWASLPPDSVTPRNTWAG